MITTREWEGRMMIDAILAPNERETDRDSIVPVIGPIILFNACERRLDDQVNLVCPHISQSPGLHWSVWMHVVNSKVAKRFKRLIEIASLCMIVRRETAK